MEVKGRQREREGERGEREEREKGRGVKKAWRKQTKKDEGAVK